MKGEQVPIIDCLKILDVIIDCTLRKDAIQLLQPTIRLMVVVFYIVLRVKSLMGLYLERTLLQHFRSLHRRADADVLSGEKFPHHP